MSNNPRLLLLTGLLLAGGGCSTLNGGDAPLDVRGADVARHVEANGDTVEEYRLGGQLRMVKITPARGPAYYLYDRDGDGRFDNDRNTVSPVYWKLYSW